MKRFLVYFVMALLCPVMVLAQKVTVSGLIMDGSNNEPLVGATVVLLQPKDSTQASGALSGVDGKFTLPAVKPGSYIMRISYVGYLSQHKNLTLGKGNKTVNVGTFTLQEDSKVLSEAEVVAKLAQVEMKADTFVYNADAFRLPEGSVLEELVKKLPGAEVDDEGNIKINGKSVSKIMVEGKEYFQNDTKMAMKNLPTKMVKKLKAYERKSDYSRITGIDDGEEETVLDLTVQKGMKEGWVVNADLAYGTPTGSNTAQGVTSNTASIPSDLYSLKLNVNRFLDHSQFSVIASRNNINDAGFPGGGRGWGGWGGGGGITTSTMVGVNFAWENGKPDYSAGLFKLGGNVRYSQRNSVSDSHSNNETFLSDTQSTFSNSRNHSKNNNYNLNANFRLEWMPDSLTNILFRPNFSYSKSDNFGNSVSATFNSSPYEAGLVDPLEQYETLVNRETGLSDIVVNHNERYSFGDSKSTNVDAELQVNRQLYKQGRNLTLNIGGEYQTSESNSYSRSLVRYFQESARQPLTATYQNTFAPSTTYRYQGRISYSEPLLAGGNLRLSYQLQRRFQDRDRTMMTQSTLADDIQKALTDYGELTKITAYNLYTGQVELQDGSIRNLSEYGIDLQNLTKDMENSQYATYKELNHSANLMYRYTAKFDNQQELRFNAGVSYQPQNTHMDYQKGSIDTTIVRTTQNWAPRIDIRWKINNSSQLRLRYFGRMNQPSMTNLIETVDSSDPLNISTGNAGLKSSWTDNFNLFYNGYNTEHQRGWSTNFQGNINRRTISSSTIYDEMTGARYSRPMNIDGNWNIGTWVMFNTAIDKKKMWNFSTNTNIDYSHNVGYISSNIDENARKFLTSGINGGVDMDGLFRYADENNLLQQSKTKTLNLRETIRLNVRGEIGASGSYEIGVNGSGAYRHDRNSIQSNANLDTWSFNYGGNIILNFPWGMALSTDLSEQCRRGYEDASMNTNELIWNAQLSQSFLKGKAATISVQWYDILRERSNVSRNIDATMRTNTWTNAVNSYVMVHFIYRLNLLGNKSTREGNRGGFGGERGGFGGERGGFGGDRGGFGGGRF
ncbi:MAG: TonB-dependent receptor [Bacteroidaceae bacterium]|nr:TonB-dependent receptor [Bacteroidaceae bacterium]